MTTPITLPDYAIEAAAKTIYGRGRAAEVEWDDMHPAHKNIALLRASAALTAALSALETKGLVVRPMEPTEAMIHDGVNALSKLSRWATSKQVENVYRAMIDVKE